MNFEEDRNIDPTALDIECLRQPNLMGEYGRREADCMGEMDDAKDRLSVAEAEWANNARATPEEYSLTKTTDKVVADFVTLQTQEEKAAYSAAKLAHAHAKSEYRAIERKDKQLQLLVQLLAAEYFSGPEAPRNLKRESDNRKKAVSNRVEGDADVVEQARKKRANKKPRRSN